MKISRMQREDVAAVIKIHRECFEGYYLTKMGPEFLRYYYSNIIEYKESIALIAKNEASEAIGFATGCKNPTAFYKNLKRNKLLLISIMVKAFAKDPSLILPTIENSLRVNNNHEGCAEDIELTSIATRKRNNGIGTALVTAFKSESEKQDGARIRLTTDKRGNEGGNQFYIKNGFKKTGEQARGNRILNIYTMTLSCSHQLDT